MKYLVLILSAGNLYLGTRCFLNVIGVLQTSKYATGTTALFMVLFLGFGIASIWLAFWGGNPKLALWLTVGPWVLAFVVLFLTMILSRPN